MESANQNTTLKLDTLFATKEEIILQDSFFLDDLAAEINQLILTNFERLVQLLYRIDVSETKLKTLLKENPDKDAGKLIALLMVERQLQKIKLKSTILENDDCEEERW
jgi:hypothetical protein